MIICHFSDRHNLAGEYSKLLERKVLSKLDDKQKVLLSRFYHWTAAYYSLFF